MNTVFDAPIVPSYAAELSDSDSDVDASDEEMDAEEMDAATTTKRPRTTDAAAAAADDASTGPLPAAKRARTGAPPPLAHSPTVAVTASTPPRPLVVAAPNESAESSDGSSDSDSDDEESSDDGDDETSHSQAAPARKVSTMERCIKKYVFIVEARNRDRRVRQSWQQIVDEARRAIQYEIDNKPAVWKEGIGRAPSYLSMMKALLNVSTVRSVNREMMLEVIEQAGEVLEARLGGE
jgi:hypothetical protein